MPSSGSSVISTCAIRLLVVGSQPGNSMPAALRTRLRPPSHPTRYSARSDRPSESWTSTPVSSWAKPVTSMPYRIGTDSAHPASQDALDVVLPQSEPVVVPGGKVADVQTDAGEPRDLSDLSLREEPVGDAALVEDLDGTREQAARARAGEVLTGAALDDGDIHTRQRQLARQHQSGRPCTGDDHRMVAHRRTAVCISRAVVGRQHTHFLPPLPRVPTFRPAIMR